MSRTSLVILRIGLGITFLWIGALILLHTDAWMSLVQPWVTRLIPMDLTHALRANAVFDIVVGIFLIAGIWPRAMAMLGALHLIQVLIVTGITDITVRDIGMLAGCLAVMLTGRREEVRS